MSAYTVKRVDDSPREWTSKQGGTFLSYTVDLEDIEGKVQAGIEWNRKPESRAPEVGDRIAGNIEPGKFSERFKMDYEATKELTGGGGSSDYRSGGEAKSKGGWKPESQYDPEKVARITRAHSQEMSIRVFALIEGHLENNDEAIGHALNRIRKIADWFDADIQRAAAVESAKAELGATEEGPAF